MTDRSEARIFLTFDDGPDPTWTPRVLEALRTSEAKATFFVISPLARRHAGLIREMARAGHAVGFHCVRHLRHTELEREQVESDTRIGLRDLESLGLRPRSWRPPWGVLAPWSGDVARELGLELVSWTADTHDWRGDGAREMLAAIGPDLRPRAIILMHDGLGPGARRSGCEETVVLIPALVERIRALGCEPAPLHAPSLLDRSVVEQEARA